MPSARRVIRPAFALVEAAACAVIVVVLGALLVVAGGETRRAANLSDDFSSLKQYAGATSAFAADNEDRVWTFSWLPNSSYTVIENGVTVTIVTPSDRAGAHAAQAAHLIRARGMVNFPTPNAWTPNIVYSHLVLLDFMDSEFPARYAVSSADRRLLDWQRAIREDRTGAAYFKLLNLPPGSSPSLLRWAFSSSFELGPAFIAQDASAGSVMTLSQGSSHTIYSIGQAPLGGRRMSEVRFPSQKAMVWDQYQRHFGPRTAFFAFPEARIPILFADGAASIRTTGPSDPPAGAHQDANRGFRPNSPSSPGRTQIWYHPDLSWEPPQPSELVTGFYRWTRSGLRGRDFGGPEVPWVP